MKVFRMMWILMLCSFAVTASAEVRLSSVFGEHMVLQRGVKIPVWGWANPGEPVSVTLGTNTRENKTAADGRWQVEFDALEAGGPLAMAVTSTNFLLIKDIYVGEVWLGSGQSNMDMTVAAEDRYWCGVMNEREEVASANYPLIRMFKVKLKMADKALPDVQDQWMVTTPETVKKYSATGYFFARELYNALHVPIGFFDSSFGGSTVQAWISPEAMQQKADYAYLIQAYSKAKADWKPLAAAKHAAHQEAMTKWAHQATKNASQGKFPPRGPSLGDPEQNQHNPSVLYNGMIAPLIPFPMRGVIWYQGESNEDAASVKIYRSLMETLISDWRKRWGEGDFPFLYVQLANLGQLALEPATKAPIALVREAQLKNLSVPNTGMAVTIDIGDAGNVHPKNKQELGRRLSLLARHIAYKEDVIASGPIFDSFTVEGSGLRVRFKYAEGGLQAKGGAPLGFAIAGSDKHFVWASAKIDGDSVLLSSPEVPSPAAVRYGWADNPPLNLYNKTEPPLPASPFRTDDW